MPAPNDTHPDIERLMIEGYRRMTPLETFQKVEQLNEAVLQLPAARIRAERPGMGERELRLRLAALWVPHDLLKRATGWDPTDESG